jgi:hypothetical protein
MSTLAQHASYPPLESTELPASLSSNTNTTYGASRIPSSYTHMQSRSAIVDENLQHYNLIGNTKTAGLPRQPLAPLNPSSQNTISNQQNRLNTKTVGRRPLAGRDGLQGLSVGWIPKSLSPRRPIQELPIPLGVYFMPDGRHIPRSSVIHRQKRQNGFFLHPILVISVDESLGIAHFYALTSNPPDAIRDLKIYLRFGTSNVDEGEDTLKLAPGSDRMQHVTFANMEQLFRVEYQYLDYWRVDVSIDIAEWTKIQRKVIWLEADQNRYIYKPLHRDMKDVVPGVVLMLPNPPESSTLGAPVLVLDVNYPYFRFLRVKEINGKGNLGGTKKSKAGPNLCVRLCRHPNHESDDVLYFEPDSPAMRNPSYLECSRKIRWVHCDQVKTWSYPHVRIQATSIRWLLDYLAKLPETSGVSVFQPGVPQRPRALPEPSRTYHPQPVLMSRPYMQPSTISSPNLPQGPRYPPPSHHSAVTSYRQQMAMQGYYTPSHHGYHLSSLPHTPTLPGHPPDWVQYQHLLNLSTLPSVGRTAYASTPGSPSGTSSFYHDISRSNPYTGPHTRIGVDHPLQYNGEMQDHALFDRYGQ